MKFLFRPYSFLGAGHASDITILGSLGGDMGK